MAGSFENGNEHSAFIKDGEFLDLLSEYIFPTLPNGVVAIVIMTLSSRC